MLLSIGIAAIGQGYRTALRAVGASDDIARATIQARSLLAAAEAGALPSRGGRLADGSRWRTVNRLRPDLASGSGIVMVEIDVAVMTPANRRVALSTLTWTGQQPGS